MKRRIGKIRISERFFEEFWKSLDKDIEFYPLQILLSPIERAYDIIEK